MRLEARGVTVRYRGAERPALAAVDVSLGPGGLHAVLGPNGSGKSTLVRALLGAVPLAAGETRVDGRPLPDWTRPALARAVGVVPQNEAFSFPVTVRQVVEMGRYPHLGLLRPAGEKDRAAVERALAACDATELAGRDMATLSGGEVQRVRIARALAQEPGALVLDEPTASLDIAHEMAIMERLRAWADEGLTVVLVTHALDLAARFADRLVLLHRGRVAAEGPPADVLREDTLARVYEWPVRVHAHPLHGQPLVTPLSGPPDGARPA